MIRMLIIGYVAIRSERRICREFYGAASEVQPKFVSPSDSTAQVDRRPQGACWVRLKIHGRIARAAKYEPKRSLSVCTNPAIHLGTVAMSEKLNDIGTVDLNAPLHAEELDDGWYVVGMGMLIPCRDRTEADAIVEDIKIGNGDTPAH